LKKGVGSREWGVGKTGMSKIESKKNIYIYCLISVTSETAVNVKAVKF